MRIRYFLPLLLLLTACIKEPFEGPDSFSEDFESTASYEELFPEDESRWSFTQITNEANSITLDSSRSHSGNYSLRFDGKASTSDQLSKCSIAKQFMAFWEGETVRMSCWYYLEGTADAQWLFLFDLEEQTQIGAGPGTRIALVDNMLAFEHKYPRPNTLQDSATGIPFPRDQWVHIEAEYYLSQKEKGYLRLWQDGQLVLSRENWQTLPKDILYAVQGTKGMYSAIEFGLTANTYDSDLVLFLDDIEVGLVE